MAEILERFKDDAKGLRKGSRVSFPSSNGVKVNGTISYIVRLDIQDGNIWELAKIKSDDGKRYHMREKDIERN